MKDEDVARFKRAFVGCVIISEIEVGEIRDLIREGKSWWSQWFSKIREWREDDMDNERASWIRCFGIPCHAWNTDLFQFLAKMVGSFICANENTMKNECMDVARFLVKMSCAIVTNETFYVCINGKSFRIKMIEDSRTPICISVKPKGNRK
ncbi:hypothetical protein KIW84_057994 [Lathyrus oleraceus]|uniref:DUF4283 domain-containing protein n=1 Tax=Pisum sativum TaxID=3888 RepID=A0A9D5ALT5_PEA|nr:hypothetical protein KIW84_057994 [Pisum sativum]